MIKFSLFNNIILARNSHRPEMTMSQSVMVGLLSAGGSSSYPNRGSIAQISSFRLYSVASLLGALNKFSIIRGASILRKASFKNSSGTRLFSNESKNKRFNPGNLPPQLIINSTCDNIIFENNVAVLKLPKIKDDVESFDNRYNLEFKASDFYFNMMKTLLNLEGGKYKIKPFIFTNSSVITQVYNYEFMSNTHLNLLLGSFGYVDIYGVDINFNTPKLNYGQAHNYYI